MLPRGPRPDAGSPRPFLRRAVPVPHGERPGGFGERRAGTVDRRVCGDDVDCRPDRILDVEPPGEGRAGQDAVGTRAPEPGDGVSAASLDTLRRLVARLEGRIEAGARLAPSPAPPSARLGATPTPADPAPRLALGLPGFDGLFAAAGGLLLPAVTELRAPETRHAGALTGFLAALLVLLASRRPGPVLWICERQAAGEAGRAAGLGLVHLGLDPARLLVVGVGGAAELLWAAEEGLGCAGLSAVVGEIHGLPRALDLTASRRLALRAREGGVPMLLAGHAMPEAASAAAVRLAVVSRPSRPAGGFRAGPGFPAWSVTVEKNRDGRTGRVDLEWNSDDRCFRELVPLPVPVAAGDPDRPSRPDAPGQVVAHPGPVRRAV
jgi:protein ImuA